MVVGRVSRRNIWEGRQVSRKTLSVKFKVFFEKIVPVGEVWRLLPPTLTNDKSPWILAIDGKWLKRQGVVMIYRDITHGENLFWSFHQSESYQALSDDLSQLVRLLDGNSPLGVVSDWKGSIKAGIIRYLGEDTPHQRCLAHVTREAKRLLPRKSSFRAILVLREIAKELPYIKLRNEERCWKGELIKWEMAFGHLLKEKTIDRDVNGPKKWWYTHGDLRRAWRLLTDDWYPFFVHLAYLPTTTGQDPLIPNTNNSIEGVNIQLKNKLLNHRGMKTTQQVSFLYWYLTFTRTKSKQDLKKLWGLWKKQKTPILDTQKVT